MRNTLLVVMLAVLLSGCVSFGAEEQHEQDRLPAISTTEALPAPVEESFLYSNEFGEELYGEGYDPVIAPNLGLELEVGRADAGVRAGLLYDLVTHDEVAQQIQLETYSGGPNTLGDVSVSLPTLPRSPEATPTGRDVIAWPAERAVSAARKYSETFRRQDMYVHFVDVGQGDGAIIEFPCGVAIIDTGGQFGGGPNGGLEFVRYLDRFFAQRPQLNRTIDVLFTTHPHFDHLRGLDHMIGKDGAPLYTILNVVDNGQDGAKGSLGRQTRFREAAKAEGASYSGVHISRLYNALGATNTAIDPFDCQAEGIDPIITAYWGGWDRNSIRALGGDAKGYSNPNNHSLILRIDFGAASFLFTGDLEHTGAEHVIRLYGKNLGILDVDVYQVSHHGADKDTSDRLIELMSPEIAVISMGHPEDPGSGSATSHGHPRTDVIDLMQDQPYVVSKMRRDPVKYWSYAGAKQKPETITIQRGIYGTGWEGDLVLRATSLGEYEFVREEAPGS